MKKQIGSMSIDQLGSLFMSASTHLAQYGVSVAQAKKFTMANFDVLCLPRTVVPFNGIRADSNLTLGLLLF
jgi:hypothetical protein